ncbi:MAG: ABC transporter permease subunit [Paracoccaceae bacterium]|jgi:urea transport system permease protein|tara:strand:- start:1411 stop:2571 length:1161 start_codon:yes stop_codon:yes gene_type:complete
MNFKKRNQSLNFVMFFLVFTLFVTIASELGMGLLSTSFVKVLGKTLMLCLAAIALDLVWGYCGILSLGHMAFFALGGYLIGMWLMYERTKEIVISAASEQLIPLTPEEIKEAIGNQIFGVVGGSDIPIIWIFADSLLIHLLLIVVIPGLLALVFGWLAFRSRVTGVYLSILTQAMTLALSLYLFQNDSGLRGNNGLSGLQNIPGYGNLSQDVISVIFLWISTVALCCGFYIASIITKSKLGNLLVGIRDDEARVRFLGYNVERYKLLIFVVTAIMAGIAGSLYYPQAGIVNPTELAPIASIYLAVWVSIGGRGKLIGAVLGAAFVSLISSFFTSGQIPNIDFWIININWVDWWLIILGLSFVSITLITQNGLFGLIQKVKERIINK